MSLAINCSDTKMRISQFISRNEKLHACTHATQACMHACKYISSEITVQIVILILFTMLALTITGILIFNIY